MFSHGEEYVHEMKNVVPAMAIVFARFGDLWRSVRGVPAGFLLSSAAKPALPGPER